MSGTAEWQKMNAEDGDKDAMRASERASERRASVREKVKEREMQWRKDERRG